MWGVTVNAVAIVAGSLVGILFKNILSEKVSQSIQVALGTITIVIGLKMALKFENVLLVVGCVAGGGVLGTLWDIEKKTEQLGDWIKRKVSNKGDSRFAVGFSMASILYCVGAMAVIGSINSGLTGDNEVLFAKATLDGVISITFAAIYGIGVAFSAISVFVYQGAIALVAPKVHVLTNPGVINNISGVGGILVMMIGLSISGIRKIPVGDYFPAIFLVMMLAPFFA
jgi:hypothetical protein